MSHGKVMCSCGNVIEQYRCMEGHDNVLATRPHPACGRDAPGETPISAKGRGQLIAELQVAKAELAKWRPARVWAPEGRGPWMQTFTGKQFFLLHPRPEDIDIRDIAHALAHQCRYNGHCERFYSVAEHSVLVSYDVPLEDSFEALMHDAAEAYTGDVIRPLKLALRTRGVPSVLDEIEEKIDRAIADKFGLRYPWPESVKATDLAVLAAERRDGMKPQPADWDALEQVQASGQCLSFEVPHMAKRTFLLRFAECRR